ncbi:MAG: hypothetical protein KAS32_12790 [Candidatus Peribacteraceae bacterium]|nr:hypothetical protein [Candidatus Peribacteraceae bacterium]
MENNTNEVPSNKIQRNCQSKQSPKFFGMPKAVKDNFEDIIRAMESGQLFYNKEMQEMVRLNLKELQAVADTERQVLVPIEWMPTKLDELINACQDSIGVIITQTEDVDDEWKMHVSKSELNLLKRNVSSLLTLYKVNPCLDEPAFKDISISPIIDEIDVYIEELKKVTTRVDMSMAMYKLKDIAMKHDIVQSEEDLIHKIFTKMDACQQDITVQAMVIEVIPMIRRLPLELEATRKNHVKKEVMRVVDEIKTGIKLSGLIDELGFSEIEIEEAIADLMDAGNVLKYKDKFYSSDHPPETKKRGRKPGKKNTKTSKEKTPIKGKKLEPSIEGGD